jgi:hypothetical protein
MTTQVRIKNGERVKGRTDEKANDFPLRRPIGHRALIGVHNTPLWATTLKSMMP